MPRDRKITEGKTKIIWDDEDGLVLIESKDDITAGDGARHDTIQNKGEIAATTTVNCFKLLRRSVPSHFIRQVDPRTFLARSVEMIPLEIVVRKIATGSYIKRNPDVVEGTFLPYLVEFFAKNDAEHDPLVIPDIVSQRLLYFDPKKPLRDGFIREEQMGVHPNSEHYEAHVEKWGIGELPVARLCKIARETFGRLEADWLFSDVTLVDLKIECGWTDDRQLVVADVIDNDSWRIWPKGEKAQMKDKEVYRSLKESTPEALGEIRKNYIWVAEQTTAMVRAHESHGA